MALYTYSLFLLRETARGSFVDDLQSAGLIRIGPNEIGLLGLSFTPSVNHDADGLTVVHLAPDNDTFEKFLAERGSEFVSWLWSCMERAGLLYAFIPCGDDSKYYEDGVSTDKFMWTQLPELLATGTVRVVHPFMMLAARLGHSRPYKRAKTLNWGLSEYRNGIGCLIGLTTEKDRGFEILEPGSMYPHLRKQWM